MKLSSIVCALGIWGTCFGTGGIVNKGVNNKKLTKSQREKFDAIQKDMERGSQILDAMILRQNKMSGELERMIAHLEDQQSLRK